MGNTITAETSTKSTTTVAMVTTAVSGTTPFREDFAKTGDSRHAAAVAAAVIGLPAACGAVMTFSRR